MGISGQYVKTFRECNLACCLDLHLDADYPHAFLDIVEVRGKTVILKGHRGGVFSREIHRGRHFEYVYFCNQAASRD